jgi:hypothetical protein
MAIQTFYFLNRYCLLFALIGMYVAICTAVLDRDAHTSSRAIALNVKTWVPPFSVTVTLP